MDGLRDKITRLENMIPLSTFSGHPPNYDTSPKGDEPQIKEANRHRPTAGGKENIDVTVIEKLDQYRQKLARNLEKLDKTREDFAQEAQNLTEVLAELPADCQSSSPYDESGDWTQENCTCSEDESSDSSYPYTCGKISRRDVTCSCSNNDSESSISPSEKSTCTCYCSKNESHVGYYDSDVEESGDIKYTTRSERFRGGLDIIKAKVSDIMKKEKLLRSNVVSQNGVVQSIKTPDLRGGLERLKIRSRDLKDFIETLENPLPLELPSRTQSTILTFAQALEGSCRNKEAIIFALGDELKIGSNKKLRSVKSEFEQIKTKKKIHKNNTKFPKLGSALGLFAILMLFVSHVIKSEILSVAKRIFVSQAPTIREVKYTEERIDEKYSFRNLNGFIGTLIYRWTELFYGFGRLLWSAAFSTYNFVNLSAAFLVDYAFYVVLITSAFFVALALIKLRKVILSFVTVPESFKSIEFVKYRNKILASRSFWFAVGFCCHAVWELTEPNIVYLTRWVYDDGTLEDVEQMEEANPLVKTNTQLVEAREYNLFDFLDYAWILKFLTTKLYDLAVFSYRLFMDIAT